MVIFLIIFIFCLLCSYFFFFENVSCLFLLFLLIQNQLIQGIKNPSISFISVALSIRIVLSITGHWRQRWDFLPRLPWPGGEPYKSPLALALPWVSGRHTQVIRTVCRLTISIVLSSILVLLSLAGDTLSRLLSDPPSLIKRSLCDHHVRSFNKSVSKRLVKFFFVWGKFLSATHPPNILFLHKLRN